MVGFCFQVNPVLPERVFYLIPCRLEDLGGMHPANVRRDRAGIDARHLQNVLKQTTQSLDFGEDQIALLSTIGLAEPRGLKIARRDAYRRERCSQVVRD